MADCAFEKFTIFCFIYFYVFFFWFSINFFLQLLRLNCKQISLIRSLNGTLFLELHSFNSQMPFKTDITVPKSKKENKKHQHKESDRRKNGGGRTSSILFKAKACRNVCIQNGNVCSIAAKEFFNQFKVIQIKRERKRGKKPKDYSHQRDNGIDVSIGNWIMSNVQWTARPYTNKGIQSEFIGFEG